MGGLSHQSRTYFASADTPLLSRNAARMFCTAVARSAWGKRFAKVNMCLYICNTRGADADDAIVSDACHR